MNRITPVAALATLALAACGRPAGTNINNPNVAEASRAMAGAETAAPATAAPPPPGEAMPRTPPIDTLPPTDAAPPATEKSAPPQY